MPCKEGYGMKKSNSFSMKKTKAWGKNLKGNPKPKPIAKKGGK